MFNFAEDLAEESLADALQNGNLRGEKSRADRETKNPGWNENGSAWVSQGYYLALHHLTCKNCGVIETRVQGVFHEEKTPSGKVQCQIMSQFQIPRERIQPTRHSNFSVNVCISCVDAFGFSLGHAT